jgi:hypothetical protein
MKLIEALNEINSRDEFEDVTTIYSKRDWNADSETILLPQPENGSTEPIQGHSYFLEVFIVKDWLDELNQKEVSLETCNRIIKYAKNDA